MGTNLKMKSLTGRDANGDLVTFDIESQGYMRVHNGYVQYSYNNETWVNVIAVADLKGAAGSDASVTTDSIKTALGYVPAKQTVVDKLSEEIGDHSKNTIVHVTNTEKETWNNKSNFSGSYNDLSDKPTIPTVPTSLKNPYKLTISLGDSSYTYDGSKAVSITIEDGSEVIY